MSWKEFITMGGYAVYVWPSYAIALLMLTLNVVLPRRRLRRLEMQLRRQFREEEE